MKVSSLFAASVIVASAMFASSARADQLNAGGALNVVGDSTSAAMAETMAVDGSKTTSATAAAITNGGGKLILELESTVSKEYEMVSGTAPSESAEEEVSSSADIEVGPALTPTP
jgi:hypothetical protein